MKARKRIDVRIERGPAHLELPARSTTQLQALPPSSRSVERGRERLVVEMPAPSPRWLFLVAAYSATFIVCVGVLLFMSGPHLRVFVISAFTSLLAVVLMMVTFGMFARREVLEVDSRVVSLRRGSQLMSWAPRQKCTHVALITSSPARTALSPFGTPRLQLGAENENWILAGFGISNGAAVRLVTAIEEFLADVPPEQLS